MKNNKLLGAIIIIVLSVILFSTNIFLNEEKSILIGDVINIESDRIGISNETIKKILDTFDVTTDSSEILAIFILDKSYCSTCISEISDFQGLFRRDSFHNVKISSVILLTDIQTKIDRFRNKYAIGIPILKTSNADKIEPGFVYFFNKNEKFFFYKRMLPNGVSELKLKEITISEVIKSYSL